MKQERKQALCGECGEKRHLVTMDDDFVYINCSNCGDLVVRLELSLDIQGLLEKENR